MTCERPEIQKAFRIEGKSPPYKYKDFVRLQCIKGYKMEGSDILICTEDGWDPPSTQCTSTNNKYFNNIQNYIFTLLIQYKVFLVSLR